jgi:predicted transposase/invertase (TIGR01784 family)
MDKIYYKGTELLPVKCDVVFKALFGREDSKDLLASLLTSLLDIPIKSPDDLILTNTELSKNYGDDKLSRLDVRVKTNQDEHIDIEVQIIDKQDMIQRSIYYVSRLYVEQMR